MHVKLNEVLKRDFEKYENKGYVYTKVDGKFVPMTFGEFLRRTDSFARFLLKEGLAGKRIMIFSENSPAWMIADLAIVGFVGSSIGAPAAWKTDDVDNEIGHLGIDCVLYSKAKSEYMKPVMEHHPNVRYYPIEITVDGTVENDAATTADGLFNMELRPYDACAKVIFSSGTTSFPKGVMLSQQNMFGGLESLYRRCQFNDNDVMYTFLPFTHTYGGIYNFYISLYYGTALYLTSQIPAIGSEILEVNPTIFCAVPLILNKMLAAYGEDKVHLAYGNRLQYLFVGGASLSREVKKLYKDKGINLIEAYALSETGSSFAFEYSHDPAIMSTGTVFEDLNVEIRNADENGIGEIYCKGEVVFLGYMNEPKLTAEVLSEDGWFKTGDLGRVDEEGHLYVTGRSKKLLLGPNGENINDEKIIQQIKAAIPEASSVKVFMLNDLLTAYVYVSEDRMNSIDLDAIIAGINEKNAKYDAVRSYKLLRDGLDTRLKQ